MKRIIVVGGLGWFGRTIINQLQRLGIQAVPTSRRSGPNIRMNADNAANIRSELRAGDLIIDAAGPFHSRSTALVEAAIEVGFDVIDLNDHLGYAQRVLALEARIAGAGIRVLNSASTVSAIASAIVGHSGIAAPTRVRSFLAPATRHTAHVGTARSLLRSLGQPILVWRNGELNVVRGWSESRQFPMPAPIGPMRGRLFESADTVHLPRIWPSLHEVAMFVHPRAPGTECLLKLAARSTVVRRMLESGVGVGTWFTRRFGAAVGGVGYEIESENGAVARYAIVGRRDSFLTAVAPVVLAAQAIVEDRFAHRGLVPPDRHVELNSLLAYLASASDNQLIQVT